MASDLTDACPELGQLVTSYISEVEDIEGNDDGPFLEETVEADRLLECASQVEARGSGSQRQGATRRIAHARIMPADAVTGG